MVAEKALIKVAQQQQADANIVKVMSSGGASFLPRLQFVSNRSDLVTSQDFPANEYGLIRSKDEAIPVGKEIEAILLAWRSCFIAGMNEEEIIVSYWPNFNEKGEVTDDFCNSVIERSTQKDSGCMWGPQLLVWLPTQNEYATLFLGSVSARIESPKLIARIGYGSLLYGKKITSKKYGSWYIPAVKPCTTITNVPAPADAEAAIAAFTNPPKPDNQPEPVKDEEKTGRER